MTWATTASPARAGRRASLARAAGRHDADHRARHLCAPADDVPEAYWNIGIRIEDDALVTDEGCELITRGVPVQAGEIEALMRE